MRTTCEWCGKRLENPSTRKKFCDSSCRAANTHAKKGTPGRPKKALRSAARTGRRKTRDGLGIRLYVQPAELAELSEGSVLPTLAEKAAKAKERLAA